MVIKYGFWALLDLIKPTNICYHRILNKRFLIPKIEPIYGGLHVDWGYPVTKLENM